MAFHAKLVLCRRPDGSVALEVRTPEPLGPQRLFDGRVWTPAEYLPDADVSIGYPAKPGYASPYVRVSVGTFVDGKGVVLVDRVLDFWEGAEERVLLSELAAQESVDVVWVNEGVTVSRPLPWEWRRAWLESLQKSEGLTLEEGVRELASRGYAFTEWPPGTRGLLGWGRKRRVASRPPGGVPFFAQRSGVVPREGRASVAGVKMARGVRRPQFGPAYWISEEPLADAIEVAGALAGAFSSSGVWPLLWLSEDDPADYMDQPGDVDDIDGVHVQTVLANGWRRMSAMAAQRDLPFGEELPALAPASGEPHAAEDWDPFSCGPVAVDARLLLVPCNRPADAITVIGGLACECNATEISAVLRSWDERFGAVPVAIEPSHCWVAVRDPPRARGDARLLAAEYVGFCAPDDLTSTTTHEVASALTDTHMGSARSFDFQMRRHLWPVGWYD